MAFTLTSVVSRLIATYMPLNESSAEARASFVGRRGTVVYAVSPDGGTVVVRDAGGDRYQLPARADATIPAGTDVVLTTYDHGIFKVKATSF